MSLPTYCCIVVSPLAQHLPNYYSSPAGPIIDLRHSVTESFHTAGLSLISSPTTSDLGATWRWVKRHRLDLSIPSGVSGDNLLIPAIDTGFVGDTKSQSSTPTKSEVRRSPRKRPTVTAPSQAKPKQRRAKK